MSLCVYCGRTIVFTRNLWRHDATSLLRCHLGTVDEFAAPAATEEVPA